MSLVHWGMRSTGGCVVAPQIGARAQFLLKTHSPEILKLERTPSRTAWQGVRKGMNVSQGGISRTSSHRTGKNRTNRTGQSNGEFTPSSLKAAYVENVIYI